MNNFITDPFDGWHNFAFVNLKMKNITTSNTIAVEITEMIHR